MQISDLGNWIFYSSTKDFDKGYYYGEWLLFFSENSYGYIASKCMEAVDKGFVKWAKHSSHKAFEDSRSGVFAFKLEDCDVSLKDGVLYAPKHALLLGFLKDNNLLPVTKSGRYSDIRYKLDIEGKGRHSGEWKGFKLSDFMDLCSGEFIELYR